MLKKYLDITKSIEIDQEIFIIDSVLFMVTFAECQI